MQAALTLEIKCEFTVHQPLSAIYSFFANVTTNYVLFRVLLRWRWLSCVDKPVADDADCYYNVITMAHKHHHHHIFVVE